MCSSATTVGGSACWFLDTRAANHMTTVRSTFSNLNTDVRGTMRYGDGSVVGIEGRETILFTCKNDGHQRSPVSSSPQA